MKYKELDDSPNWQEVQLLKPGVTAADVINPTGELRGLDTFIVDPETYLLRNRIISRKQGGGDITREQYLRQHVADEWFVGDKQHLVDEYFQNGD